MEEREVMFSTVDERDKLLKTTDTRESKRRHSDNWKRYLGWGLTAFAVVTAAILLIFLFNQADTVTNPFGKLSTALAPVFLGMLIAYIVNPLMKAIERKVRLIMLRFKKPVKNGRRVARYISLTLSMLCVILVIGFMAYLLIPQLSETISGIIKEAPGQIENFLNWFNNSLVLDDSELGTLIQGGVNKATQSIEDFIQNKFADLAANVAGSITTWIGSILGTIYNVVIGMIFAIYILASKETLGAQIRKIMRAMLKADHPDKLLRVVDMCHTKFTGAIIGKILDSMLVGVICFFGMLIFRFPYAALISVVVAVTNVLPFFGPYIGAVPSALLVLFVDPVKCLWFIVFVVVLQQIDCNILDPRIVGNSIGLSAFWVLFACVVFGSLFGILGLLMGVPLMACIYMLVKDYIENRLREKGAPIDTDAYR